MPSLDRRTFLASSTAILAAASGCATASPAPQPAHTVTVYLGEREETHDVSVTVRNGDGESLFEKDYRLSDANEADEDATFSVSTDPETVVTTVDGTRFERDWPGFEDPQLPCDGENWAGIELWTEDGSDGTPEVRLETNCQHVTTD